MKKIMLSGLLLLMFNAQAWAGLGDSGTTSYKTIDRIQFNEGTNPTYYLTPEGGNWGALWCPDANYVYFYGSHVTSSDLMALALMAKASGAEVAFSGVCGPSSSSYISVDYAFLK